MVDYCEEVIKYGLQLSDSRTSMTVSLQKEPSSVEEVMLLSSRQKGADGQVLIKTLGNVSTHYLYALFRVERSYQE